MSAVILAGGRSSRMGKNKLLIPLGDKPLIGHLIDTASLLFAEVIVVTDEPDTYSQFPVLTTRDLILCPQKNALAGIHAGLVTSQTPYVFVAAGDMPFVQSELLQYLCGQADGYDVTVPREGKHFQPLCSVYHKNCIPEIERLLLSGGYKIADFFAHVRVRHIDSIQLRPYDPELVSFFNINTPEDYRRAQELLNERTRGGK
jgi:molybdopterin-guanine dinucleotide biosynthesis protein A